MTGQLNRRVILRRWGSSVDDGGGILALLVSAWSRWAKVEDRQGSIVSPHAQEQWQYDYKITLRYEKSRPIQSNDTIDYDGKRLKIKSLSILEEGQRRYYVCRCTTIETLTLDNSFANYLDVDTYYYTGIGSVDPDVDGEVEFTVPSLNGKKIIGAFKDGVNFKVVTTEPDVTQKEMRVVSGVFKWSVPFVAGEVGTLQYTNV